MCDSILAESGNVDAGACEFARVTDEPAFKAGAGIDLGMELEAKDMIADGEGLLLNE